MTHPAPTSTPEQGPHAERVYLLPVEAAKLLRTSTKSLYRWTAADPTLPALRIGGSLRYPRERLLRWLASREQGRRAPHRTVRNLASSKGADRDEAALC